MDDEMKRRKEEFVIGFNGGSVVEIAFTMLSLMLVYITWKLLYIANLTPKRKFPRFIFEFFFFCIPIFLSMTFVKAIFFLYIGLLIIIGLLFKYPPFLQNKKKIDEEKKDKVLQVKSVNGKKKPFLTIYRSILMMLTCTAILAVDFKIFPRRFAKTEIYGTSLMDLGVGGFIFSSGIINGRRLNSQIKENNKLKMIFKTILSSSPVIILGIIRFISVKALNYQEHETEYGLHWNFFFTLGFIPIGISIISALFSKSFNLFKIAIIETIAYQIALKLFGLEYWALNAPRTNILSMNREGITSLLGYISLYLFSAAFGANLLEENRSKKEWIMVGVKQMIASVIITFSFGGLELFFNEYPSRRIANPAYVFWIVGYNLFYVIGFLFVDLFIGNTPVPALFESLNRNQLFVFLVANLLTGFVNLTINTIDASSFMATIINLTYVFLLALFAYVCDQVFNITLKFW